MMKRRVLLILGLWCVFFPEVNAQIFTGGRGDGATMSCVPPKVTTLGETDIRCVSDTIVLAIYATGSSLQYIWQKMGSNFYEDLQDAPHLIGLGTDTLRIVLPDKDRDDGRYRCMVKNTCDLDTSDVFVLSLNRPPHIEVPLSTSNYAQAVCANETPMVDLQSTILSPRGDHKYSWVRIDTTTGTQTVLSDTTSYAHIQVAGAALDVEGLYVVTATNSCGVVRDSVFLPVYRAPQILWENLVNGEILSCVGEYLNLQATVTGGGFCYYTLEQVYFDTFSGEWRVSTSIYPDQPEHAFQSVATSVRGYWRWRVTNECGESISERVYVNLEETPSFSLTRPDVYLFPADTTVCEGSTLELMCKATGASTRYYWLKDGERIAESDSNVLVLKDIKEEDAGNYTCVAYNSCMQTARARSIKVSLALRPRLQRDPYLPRQVCLGDTLVRFKFQQGLDIPVDSMRWMFNGDFIYDGDHYSNTTTEELYMRFGGEPDLGLYQVMLYNRCGATVSEGANLYDLALPVSFLKGVEDYDALLCPGKEQRLSVAVSGSAPIHYKWILNEHSYETDTNYVNVKGQSVSNLNKYTVFAYNVCGSAIDTGWLQVERFDYFKFIGNGEVCEDAEPTGYLELQGSDTGMVYTLYRDYGQVVETFKGTGDVVSFENMPAGTYYVTAENKATECIQEMAGRPEIVSLKSPAKFNFFVSSYYCMNDVSNGAELVLTGWENDVLYTLQRLNTTQYPDWTDVGRQKFTGGVQIYPQDELNSPDPGDPKVYSNIGTGRYRIIAKNPASLNQCTRTVVLEDSLYILDQISRHRLKATNNDTVNCVRMADGQVYKETASLDVDRFIEGATYTLYKDGVPDSSHEPDRTAPIGWTGITSGTYKVVIETKQGCTDETNEVRISSVNAPLYQTLSGDNDPCADSDALPLVSRIFVDSTEIGITYSLYQETPRVLIPQPLQGTGEAIAFQVPGKKKATYMVVATDATGMCSTTFEETYSIGASDYVVAMNPSDIFLDGKGKTTWLHVDITGDYVHPLDVQWWQESQLQQTGISNLPNGQYYQHYYWPFCPCEDAHGYWGETWQHGEGGHTPNCTLNKCPFLYHTYDPKEHGCIYRGTVKDYYERGGTVRYGNKYDLYFCKDGVDPELSETYYENDTLNPFRNRLTTPVNEDRKYAVTVTDGAGCQHSDSAIVKVMGGKLRAEIIYSEVVRYYEYPFCGRFHSHQYHRCNAGCNVINCPVMYHDPHRFDGCTLLHTEHTPYNGGHPVQYREYGCCTGIEAQDTIVNRNSKLLFCSDAHGGDYNYNKYWSFEVPGDSGSSWSNVSGDSVVINSIKESGWLRLRVTSMGQEARDSIWIEVVRQKFVATIQDIEGHNIDTVKVCRGDEVYLYAFTDGGDDYPMFQWYGDGASGPNERTWVFKPQQSGDIILTATNDGVVVRDTAYICLQDRPTKPEIEDFGPRCVTNSWESIRVVGLDQGANYVLEFSRDSGATYTEYKRLNNVQGAALEFRINEPNQYLGLFRVKVEGNKDSDACDAYSDVFEFIGQPTHNQMISDRYCYGDRRRGLTLQLNSTEENMSYTILFDDYTWKETIDAPVNFFDGPLTQGDYYLVYTRKGIIGSCSDTVPINIKEVAPAQEVEIADHTPACEGSNAVLTIAVTEPQVEYYLKSSTTGEKLNLFTGNGGQLSATIPARSAGSYFVIAELDGCENQVGIFNFYKKPEKIEQEDIHYCYPYGSIASLTGTELEYSGLRPDVTYTLIRDGREVESLTGGGTMSFTNVIGGSYLLVAKDNITGCASETAFIVDARRSPKDFVLAVDCAKEKNVTLEYSQENVSYVLYRDTLALDTIYGTGGALSFGVQNVSGKYTVLGTDTITGCSEKMDGEVVINEIGYCDLIQETQICEAGRATAVIYPCSKTGWDYYIKNVTDPANTLNSNTMSGNGGEITWESMGPGGDFKPTQIGRNQYKPSTYILYGKDECGDIPLDTLTIALNTPPEATLEVGGVMLNQTLVHRTKTMRGCANEPLEFFLSNVVEGVECTLIGVVADNFADTLTQFFATSEHLNRTSIGTYSGGYTKYICYLKDGTCVTQLTLSVIYRDLPDISGVLDGTSVCEGFGTLDITLSGKVPGQNYYLMREGEAQPLDTILYSETGIDYFATQTETGRYYILTENIDLTPDGLSYTTICRDTLPKTFAIGDVPTKYSLVSWPDRKHELFLCLGEQKRVSLLNSEGTVDYALMKDGVEIGGRQHKEGGGRLTFGVKEGGLYTVRGFLGRCEVDMLDSVMVYADTMPNLQLFDKYYYCRDEEGGAKIEIEDAPMYTIAELKAGGVSAIPMAIDTVRHRGDTIKFDTRCTVGDIYYLSIRTYGGCQFDHPFTVEKKRPPKDLKLFLTANAICEGECTKVAIVGDEGNIEYELRYADRDHSIYNDNFIMGFGDRDTLWFPYAICETGNYQVIATLYDRPYCETVLPYNDQGIIALQDNDTIYELNFESNEIHYCADDGTLGATITLLDAQAGLEYYLFRGDSCLNRLGFPKIVATTDGEQLEWRNVPSAVKCQSEGDYYTTYRVLARNPGSGCEKWMKDSVRVYADSYVNGLANSTATYDFCEGASILLKVRAEGCGLKYNWKHKADDGTVTTVGNALPDLWLENATIGMTGQYYCEVSNACNLSTPTINNAWISPVTDVYVRDLVYMEDQESITVCEGTSEKIYSKMTNVSEGDYAWFREDEPARILSTRSYLSLDHITIDMQGYYICRGGREVDGYCNELYDTIFIEVAKNVDSLQFLPVYDTLCIGETLNLSMVGNVPNEYIGKWYHNGVDLSLLSTGYTKSAVTRADAGVYTVELRRTSGATCGDTRLKTIGVIAVDSLITPLWHTEDKELCQAQKIALSVRTMPMSGVNFEWTRIVDGAPEEMVGYGADVLTEIPEGVSNIIYKAYFHNKCDALAGGTNTVSTNVNITQNAGFAQNLPSEITGCEGEQPTTTLTVIASSVTVTDYVWIYTPASSTEVDTVDAGSTNSNVVSYTIPFDHEHSGFYTCILQTDCGRITSNACWVRVNSPATITGDLTAVNGKMCEGSYFTPSLTATGSDLQFRWFVTYPDGSVDTVRKAIGYDWEATDQLDLLTETKYNGGKLQCKVWNNCREDLSEEIDLQIIAPRDVNVVPAETWLCFDSTATVEIELLGGDGDAWSYKLQRNDYGPTAYHVDAGYSKDTVENLISGKYTVINLNDGICDYRDKVMAEFMVNDIPQGTASFSMASGRRDTLVCFGRSLPMLLKVDGGTGPFEVSILYKTVTMVEPALYNGWVNANPFVISAAAARRGYNFSMNIMQNAEFSIKVVDLANDKVLTGCPLEMGADQVIRVAMESQMTPAPSIIPNGSLNFGECELDIDLRLKLNVSPPNGTFHIVKQLGGGRTADTIDRDWAFAKILRTDGPGLYSIGYSLNNTCRDAASPINIKIDSLPYVTLTPIDTVLCCNVGFANIQAHLHGAGPFSDLRIDKYILKTDGIPGAPSSLPAYPSPSNPQYIPSGVARDCSDSIIRHVVTYVKDKYGCAMPASKQVDSKVRVHRQPALEVIAYHPAYSGGYGDAVSETFNLHAGDSVTFRISLSSRSTPWTLKFSYLQTPPPAVPHEQFTTTVTGVDTLITVKKEGWYIFSGAEIGACATSEVTRVLKLAPPGYISIEGLFLGGALSHLCGTTPVDIDDMRMKSRLWNAPGFPDYGYDHTEYANHLAGGGQPAIDWIFVEARKLDENNEWLLVDRDTCILLADGTVRNRKMGRALEFEGTGVSGEHYYVAVFHRNHLPAMTPHAQQFGPSSPTPISFGRKSNFYFDGSRYNSLFDDHYWKFWVYYGQPIYVLAPSYKQINKLGQLVSLSNAVQTYLELEANASMKTTRGYYIWDVTCNGFVEIPALLSNFTSLPNAGYDEDAWMLFQNRDRFTEIDDFFAR